MERHAKNKRVFTRSYSRPSSQGKPLSLPKAETILKDSKVPDKGKGIVKEFPKKLDGKRCFKCQSYGHFQADCPNIRALTIKEIKEIGQINLESSEGKEELDEEATVLPPDVGEFVVLKRILHTVEGSKEDGQREQIFHSQCTI